MTTHQLALRLQGRGHAVASLMRIKGRAGREYVYRRQVNLTTKLGRRPPSSVLLLIQRQMGRLARSRGSAFGYPVYESVFPENALPGVARRFRPDVVVASSIGRIAWRRSRSFLQQRGIPTVLYMRGVSCLGHLSVSRASPELVLSNTGSVTEQVRTLGFGCETIASVVETAGCRVDSSREVLLLVNPIPLLGVETAWEIAKVRPDIPLVFQESWPVETQMDELRDRARGYPNVEIRSFSRDPRQVFKDARVLLAPHRVDNRPRVVLEAQTNGIPVIATDHPGLVEAVGQGGILVDPEAPIEQWTKALSLLWDDPDAYTDYVGRARDHSCRAEVDAEALTERFEGSLLQLVTEKRGTASLEKTTATPLRWLRA